MGGGGWENSGVLPGDLIEKILEQLPVKSLLRFESVSKGWQSLILSPEFISNHGKHMKMKQGVVKYLHSYSHDPHCSNGDDCSTVEHFRGGISLISKGDNNIFSTSIVPLDDDRLEAVSIVGPCSNGLVCIKFWWGEEDYIESLGIWNPATRKLKFLPNRPLPKEYSCVNFSYVPSTACYKLVEFSWVSQEKGFFPRVHVLEIGQDCWREVFNHGQYEPSMGLPFYIDESPMAFNGCLYWYGRLDYGRGSSLSMVGFDMEKEVFFWQAFDLPQEICKLAIYEGKLALFVSVDEENKVSSQVWIYEEGEGGNQTWRNRLIFGPLPAGHRPVGFWGDEIIIEPISYDLPAYLYNPHTKHKSYSPCTEIHYYSQCELPFYPYVETLVRI